MNFFKKAKIETVNTELVYSGWNKIYRMEIDYTNSRGQTSRIIREIMDHGTAAAILLYDPVRDSVVLVRQFRAAPYFAGQMPYVLEIPAGLLDGEAPEAAIQREALEETGYMVEDPHFILKTIASPGSLTETIDIYAARIDLSKKTSEGGGLDDEHEDIEIVEMRLDEAYERMKSGEIHDTKTIIALQWAMLNRQTLAEL